jgi:hypothetical protein
MISDKDAQFLDYLIVATRGGKIPWQATAGEDQFTASLKGKYNVVVGAGRQGLWIKMTNADNQTMLLITDDNDPAGRVQDVFDEARRSAFDVDAAIDDIVHGE